jgi:hypothetical protein
MNHFYFYKLLGFYLNISLLPKAKKEKIAKFSPRGLEKYVDI